MTFWDRAVLTIYRTMAAHLQSGRRTALKLVETAHRAGHLPLLPVENCPLEDCSLLVLLMLTSEATALKPECLRLRHEALDVAKYRNLFVKPQTCWRLAAALGESGLADILEIGRPYATPSFERSLVFRCLAEVGETTVVNDLCRFLGAMFLCDPASRYAQAYMLVVKALLGYWNATKVGMVDFLARLYRLVLLDLSRLDQPSASTPAAHDAGWFESVEESERVIIRRCISFLSERQRLVLYLQVYAGLNLSQIAEVYRETTWAPDDDDVAAELLASWEAILQ